MTPTTTLARIRASSPCRAGFVCWGKLLAHLGKTKADNKPLPLLTVLDSNGLKEALWVLSHAMQPEHDRLSRHFQAWCAEQVLHIFETNHPNDTRVRDQIVMLRNDEASTEDRDAVRDDAEAASLTAARDAAAWGAARAAAWRTARAAAQAAAQAAAWRTAQASVAWDTESPFEWSLAIWDIDALDAALDAQERQLRKMLTESF